jgi:ABC-type uncharacterized transport system substrate-binding protein
MVQDELRELKLEACPQFRQLCADDPALFREGFLDVNWHASKAIRTAVAVAAMTFAPHQALTHPHVFAEASLEVAIAPDGTVESLGHVWRFDDLFSSTVLLEFDRNGDLELDEAELQEVADVVYQSLAEFDYFQMVTADGKDVTMRAPDRLIATFENEQLVIMFQSQPAEPLKLAGKIDLGIYDPTFYTAIDFLEDDMMMVKDLPAACSRAVIRPDPDEAIAQNQQTLTEAFFNDPAGTDYSKIFATRLELNCGARG